MVDDRLALRPGSTGIEALSNRVRDNFVKVLERSSDDPVGINDSAHQSLDLLLGGTMELVVDTGSPGGVRVGVNDLNVRVKFKRLLLRKHLEDVMGLTELDLLAGLLGLGEIDHLSLLLEVGNALLELGELLEERLSLLKHALAGVLNCGLAELADEVVLGEEVVDAAGGGNGGESGDGERAHTEIDS